MKKIIVLFAAISFAVFSGLHTKSSSNGLTADGGTGRSTHYDIEDKVTKVHPGITNSPCQLDPTFNFNNATNVLLVFESTRNYIATYHVNDMANTNPKDVKNEYQCNDKHANDLDIFMSTGPIYFSVHANGGMSSFHNLTINNGAGRLGNALTVLKLGGSASDMKIDTETPVAKQSNGSPYSLEDQAKQEWDNASNTLGQTLHGDGGYYDATHVFQAMADDFFNYDHPNDKINGSSTNDTPYNVNLHVFTY